LSTGWPGAVLALVVIAVVALIAAFVLPRRRTALREAGALVFVTCIALVFDWIAFGEGAREFTGATSVDGVSMRSAWGETAGRAFFGFLGVVFDVAAIGAWYRWLRKRRGQRPLESLGKD